MTGCGPSNQTRSAYDGGRRLIVDYSAQGLQQNFGGVGFGDELFHAGAGGFGDGAVGGDATGRDDADRGIEFHQNLDRRLEDVLLEWIDRASSEIPVESLPDEQVLTLCDLQMETQQQEVFSDLLARQREGQLNDTENSQLDELKLYI